MTNIECKLIIQETPKLNYDPELVLTFLPLASQSICLSTIMCNQHQSRAVGLSELLFAVEC